jgi:transcription-repair coupling factor (superfamily II helicase)
MRDLEIRGAGSLLGAEQSGNVSAVGFDLYAEMLREAVAEARGESLPAPIDVRVDLPVPAFLPEEYVPAVDQRVKWYRALASVRTPETAGQLGAGITEMHGPMPEEARNLVELSRIRASMAEAGLASLVVTKRRLIAGPVHLDDGQRGRLAALGAVLIEREQKVALPLDYGGSVMEAAAGMLGAILDADSAPMKSQEEA